MFWEQTIFSSYKNIQDMCIHSSNYDMTSCISLITRRIHRRIISLRRKEKKKEKEQVLL